MSKSKSTRSSDRTKRNPRDPGPEREEQREEQNLSDGRIDAELDELDTDKYEPPALRKER